MLKRRRPKFILTHILFTALSFWTATSHAQLDSDSRFLLSPTETNDTPIDYDSGRYKLRVSPTAKKSAPAAGMSSTAVTTSTAEVRPALPREATVPALPKPAPRKLPRPPVSAAEVTSVEAELPPPPSARDVAPLNSSLPREAPGAVPAAAPLKPSEGEFAMSLSLSPTYMFINSDSSFSPRQYSASAPGLALGLELWLTPAVGIKATYVSSLNASVPNGANGNSAFEAQMLDAGLRLRRSVGENKVSLGLDAHESRDKISRDSTTLLGHTSLGLGLVFEGELPSSASYAHTLAVSFQPALFTSEDSTALSQRSGLTPRTNAIDFSFGGTWKFDREDRVFWRGEVRAERTLYGGRATGVDPRTNLAPDRVDVTESSAIVYFGFNWGS